MNTCLKFSHLTRLKRREGEMDPRQVRRQTISGSASQQGNHGRQGKITPLELDWSLKARAESFSIQIKQLLDAVSRQDVYSVILCLAYSKPDDVNSCVSQLDRRTSLHIAASQSNTVILQLLIWVRLRSIYVFLICDYFLINLSITVRSRCGSHGQPGPQFSLLRPPVQLA